MNDIQELYSELDSKYMDKTIEYPTANINDTLWWLDFEHVSITWDNKNKFVIMAYLEPNDWPYTHQGDEQYFDVQSCFKRVCELIDNKLETNHYVQSIK